MFTFCRCRSFKLFFLINIILQFGYLEVVYKGKYVSVYHNAGYLTHQDSNCKSICFEEMFKHSLYDGQNNHKRPIMVCSLYSFILP